MAFISLLTITTALPDRTLSPHFVIIFYVDLFRITPVTAAIPRAPFIKRFVAPCAREHFTPLGPTGSASVGASVVTELPFLTLAQPNIPSLALYPSLSPGYFTTPLMAHVLVGLDTI
ncbi:hypothetical protein ACSQ67_000888 [Phaseolus vulgaris]